MDSEGDKAVIAIPHISVDISAREFLRNIEVVVEGAKERGAHLVVIPSPLHPLIDVLRGTKRISSYESFNEELINRLLYLSNKFLLYILISPTIRRAGSKRYLTSVLLTPQGGEVYVRKILSDSNLQGVISPSKDVNLLEIGNEVNTKVCTLIGSDILIPEIPRLCNFLGSDIMISIQLPLITTVKPDIIKSIAITRAVENSVPLINLGSYTRDRSNLIPTLVVSSAGDVIDLCEDFESSLLIVEVGRRNIASDEFIVKNLKNLIRKMII